MLLFKGVVVENVLPALGVAHLEGPFTTTVGRWLLTPPYPFDPADAPPAPDYARDEFWAFNPTRAVKDAADLVVPGLEPCSGDECASCSAFYLHPSTWYTASGWNAPALHPVTSYLSDDAIGPQQANAFNSMCRIFAPRFRQMAAAGYLQERGLKDANSSRALELAYSDVKRAFEYFLKHHHRGEPIFIAGHSQGGLLGEKLIRDLFADKPLARYLAAGYLVGTTVWDVDFQGSVKVCAHGSDVQCIVSWRTFGRGGDTTAFLHMQPPVPGARRVCTNPLSWQNNGARVGKDRNLGGLQLMHYRTMLNYLVGVKKPRDRVAPPALIPNISDAECVDGDLFVERLAHTGYGWGLWPFPCWTFATFPGLNYHTYDYNLFFGNVRANVRDRVRAWYAREGAKLRSVA